MGCKKCGQTTCTCSFAEICSQTTYLADSVYLPGTAGNLISTPDSAILSMSGDLDIRVKLNATDYTPGASAALVAKYNETGNQRSYLFHIRTDGKLELVTSTNGTAIVFGTSTVGTGFVDASTKWVRVNFDANDGGGNRVYIFYVSSDGVNWIQLGTTVTTAGTTTIFDSTAVVEIGSYNAGTAELFTGSIFYAEIRRGPNITSAGSGNAFGYDGDIIGVFDPKRATVLGNQIPATLSSQTGETWALAGTTWAWQTSLPAGTCATLTGNGRTYSPINYRPNSVPLPRPYGHMRKQVSNQTIPPSTVTAIIFDTDETPFNDSGAVDIASHPTKIIATADGIYLASAQITYETVGEGMTFDMYKNGSSGYSNLIATQSMDDLTEGTLTLMTIIDMAAGDYLEVYANNFTGSPATIRVNGFGIGLPSPMPGINNTDANFLSEWIRPL